MLACVFGVALRLLTGEPQRIFTIIFKLLPLKVEIGINSSESVAGTIESMVAMSSEVKFSGGLL